MNVRQPVAACGPAVLAGGPADRACPGFPGLPFGLIGPGRVGSALTAALVAAGYQLVVSSGPLRYPPTSPAREGSPQADPPDPEVAAPVFECSTPGSSPAWASVRLLLIAVADDALPTVAAEAAGWVCPGQVVAHTSGCHGLAVLNPLAAVGAVPLALHPAMTFVGVEADRERLTSGISFAVGADQQGQGFAEQLVATLGGRAEWIDEGGRPGYHAALTHGANHLVTLVNDAGDLLRRVGVTNPSGVLRPLLTAALDNALSLGDAALTGPVSRGDPATVAAHLVALRRLAPDAAPGYRVLAQRTVQRAFDAGRLTGGAAARLVSVLSDDADGADGAHGAPGTQSAPGAQDAQPVCGGDGGAGGGRQEGGQT